MATPTYVPLATITLASTDSSITFSSIPATYRDLIVVFQYSSTVSNPLLTIRFNGDSGSNYSMVNMIGSSFGGASSSSTTFTSIYPEGGNQSGPGTELGRGIWKFEIMDYSATDKHKTVLQRHNSIQASATWTTAQASRWANTSAITSINFNTSNAMAIGSTFSLYGVN